MDKFLNSKKEKILRKVLYSYTKNGKDASIVIGRKMVPKIDISIIIAAYNSEKFISEALKSAISQDYSGEIEVFISYDRGTKDKTLDKIIEFISKNEIKPNITIKILFHDYLTLFRDKIFSIENSYGEYITFLDSDNIIFKNKLKEQVNILISKNLHFVFSDSNVIDEKGKILKEHFQKVPKNYFSIWRNLTSGYIDLTSIMFDRYFYKRYLRPAFYLLKDIFWDDTLEDYFITLIATASGNIYYYDKVLQSYRFRFDSTTAHNVKDKDYKWFIKAIKNSDHTLKALEAFLYVNSKLHFVNNQKVMYLRFIDDKYNVVSLQHPIKNLIKESDKMPIRLMKAGLYTFIFSIKLTIKHVLAGFKFKLKK